MNRRLSLAIAGAVALSSSLLVSCSQPAAQTEGSAPATGSGMEDTTGMAADDPMTDSTTLEADGAPTSALVARSITEIEELDQQLETLISQDPPPTGMVKLLEKQEAAHDALTNLEAAGDSPTAEDRKAAKRAIARYRRNLERVKNRTF